MYYLDYWCNIETSDTHIENIILESINWIYPLKVEKYYYMWEIKLHFDYILIFFIEV